MTYKNLRKKTEGFTIIEVLIVLAIAGLIMLIVFLAVPALQRNSRNTAIKNDVSSVLGGVSEYQAANNGKTPTGISGTGTITFSGATGTNSVSIDIQGSTQVTLVTAATYPAPGAVNVRIGAKCDGTTSARAVSALFVIERASGGNVNQCQDS
jgi:prepilin-type N-terminal cleavage/methylation domain-containing protein